MSKKDKMNEVTKCEDGKYRDKDGVEYITIEEGIDALFEEGSEIRSTETLSFTFDGVTAEMDIISITQSAPMGDDVQGATMERTGVKMDEFRVDGEVISIDKTTRQFRSGLLRGLFGKIIAAYPEFKDRSKMQ